MDYQRLYYYKHSQDFDYPLGLSIFNNSQVNQTTMFYAPYHIIHGTSTSYIMLAICILFIEEDKKKGLEEFICVINYY